MIKSSDLFMRDKSYWPVENTRKWHQQSNSDLRHSSSKLGCSTSCHLYKAVETKMKMSVYELLPATYINISDGHSSHCFF